MTICFDTAFSLPLSWTQRTCWKLPWSRLGLGTQCCGVCFATWCLGFCLEDHCLSLSLGLALTLLVQSLTFYCMSKCSATSQRMLVCYNTEPNTI